MQKAMAIGIVVLVVFVVVGLSWLYLLNNQPPQPPYENYSSVNTTGIAYSINNLSFKVYSKLGSSPQNQSANLFFSPFSVFTAMSMAAEGAGGTTAKQMQDALGLSSNDSINHMNFEKLVNGINSHGEGYKLSMADGIWVEKTYQIKPAFLNTLSTYYDARAQQADFVSNAAGETSVINNWVANKTNNKITNLIPQGALDALTRLVLVDAIYFKDAWASPFDVNMTKNASFYTSLSGSVQVPMMTADLTAPYYSNSKLQALEMDYNNSNITMLVLLPAHGVSLSTIESGLSVSEINNIQSQLVGQEVQVWFPKFNITESYSMAGPLASLGMDKAFDPTAANFSNINSSAVPNSDKTLYISAVFHKAFINLNESGTEAAAATAVIMGIAGAMPGSHPTPPVFRADHPFVFFIIDKQTGVILFMGRVADPSKAN